MIVNNSSNFLCGPVWRAPVHDQMRHEFAKSYIDDQVFNNDQKLSDTSDKRRSTSRVIKAVVPASRRVDT